MDFNQLYSDHQRLLMRAAGSSVVRARRDRESDARHVAGRIGSEQRILGATAASTWEILALERTFPGVAE